MAAKQIEARHVAGFSFPAHYRQAAMPSTFPPSKQLVLDYMDSRTRSTDPPPTLAKVRRQLGWDLLSHNRQPDADDTE